jgi:hypothetical protein
MSITDSLANDVGIKPACSGYGYGTATYGYVRLRDVHENMN